MRRFASVFLTICISAIVVSCSSDDVETSVERLCYSGSFLDFENGGSTSETMIGIPDWVKVFAYSVSESDSTFNSITSNRLPDVCYNLTVQGNSGTLAREETHIVRQQECSKRTTTYHYKDGVYNLYDKTFVIRNDTLFEYIEEHDYYAPQGHFPNGELSEYSYQYSDKITRDTIAVSIKVAAVIDSQEALFTNNDTIYRCTGIGTEAVNLQQISPSKIEWGNLDKVK